MTNPLYFIFVEGGVVQYVKDEHDKETKNLIIFDLDNGRDGKCPVCGHYGLGQNGLDEKICPSCDWNEDDDDEVMILKYRCWKFAQEMSG